MDGFAYYSDGYNAVSSTVLLTEGTYFYNYDGSLFSTTPINMAGSFDVTMEIADAIRYTNTYTGATHNGNGYNGRNENIFHECICLIYKMETK